MVTRIRMVRVALSSWANFEDRLWLRMYWTRCLCLRRTRAMTPLAQAMMTRHIISLRDKITPISKKPNLSGMVEEQYLWIPLAVRFLLFCGAFTILVTWILSMRCRIQQRKQQLPIHFEDLILRLSHPEVLG